MATAGVGGSVTLAPVDRTLLVHAAAWTGLSLLALGVVTAIVPNPVFGRGSAPEPFAVAVWLASGPLMGLVLATYSAPERAVPVPLSMAPHADGSRLGALGSAGVFLAVGCPTCNKIALLLFGPSGASSVFGPVQPFIGATSLVLLGATVAWRLRMRARGGACPTN